MNTYDAYNTLMADPTPKDLDAVKMMNGVAFAPIGNQPMNGTVCVLSREGELRCGSPEEIMTEEYMNQIYHAKLKIKYLEDEHRMICISESL